MRIFAYWNKPGSIPAYLQLCLATWQAHGGLEQVCLITDANLHHWITEGTLDLNALGQYPVPQRKDAIEIAILARYGGLFLDVDTICASPPLAIQRALVDYELALYGYHLAVVAARPGSTIVSRWLELLQQTLTVPREKLVLASGSSFFMLGNYTFELLRNELATGKPAIPGETRAKPIEFIRKIQRYRLIKSPRQRFIGQFDPEKCGFIGESNHRKKDKLNAIERYQSFWFSEHIPIDTVATHNTELIGLHHSWTPEDYCAMGLEQLTEDRSLLSRYLLHLLDDFDMADFNVFKDAGINGDPDISSGH